MGIVLIRVDDRLIHGQVTIGWTRALRASRIVVADDVVANDANQRILLDMASDPGTNVSILSVEEAAQEVTQGAFDADKVLLLTRGPEPLVRLIEAGVEMKKVNVGNVRKAADKARISKELHAGADELEAWKTLDEKGVELEAQWLPDQKRTKLNEAVRKA